MNVSLALVMLILCLFFTPNCVGHVEKQEYRADLILVAHDAEIPTSSLSNIIDEALSSLKGLEVQYLPYKPPLGLHHFFQTNKIIPGLVIGPTESSTLAELSNRRETNLQTLFISPSITTDVSEYPHLKILQASATDDRRVKVAISALFENRVPKTIYLVHENDIWGEQLRASLQSQLSNTTVRAHGLTTRRKKGPWVSDSIVRAALEENAHAICIALSREAAVNELLSMIRGYRGFVKYKPVVVLLSNYPINGSTDDTILASEVGNMEVVMTSDLAQEFIPNKLSFILLPDVTRVLRLAFQEPSRIELGLQRVRAFYEQDRTTFTVPDGFAEEFHTTYHKFLSGVPGAKDLNLFRLPVAKVGGTNQIFTEFYRPAAAESDTTLAFERTKEFVRRNAAFCALWLHAAIVMLCYFSLAFALSGKTVVRFRRFWYHWRFLLLTGLSTTVCYAAWIAWVLRDSGQGRAVLLPLTLAAVTPSLLSAADQQLQRLNLPINITFLATFLNKLSEGLIEVFNSSECGKTIANLITHNNADERLKSAAWNLLLSPDISENTANKFSNWLKEKLNRSERLAAGKSVTKIYADFIAEMMIYKHGTKWDRIETELNSLDLSTAPEIVVLADPASPSASPNHDGAGPSEDANAG